MDHRAIHCDGRCKRLNDEPVGGSISYHMCLVRDRDKNVLLAEHQSCRKNVQLLMSRVLI